MSPPAATPSQSGGHKRRVERDRLRTPNLTKASLKDSLKVDMEVKIKVDSFKDRITAEAEDLVANFFPKKILELDAFLKDPLLNIHDLTQIHSDVDLPIPDAILLTNSHVGLEKKRQLESCEETFQGFVMPNGMMKSNHQLVNIIEKLKPEIRLLIEKCNAVKIWLQLLIPKIEDGNNFGIEVQEATMDELHTVEKEATSYLEKISAYYTARAKAVSKIAKYPHVEDYRRAVMDMDEKEYLSLRFIILDLRNTYVVLHDMILKNFEKIKRPRSSNVDTLY